MGAAALPVILAVGGAAVQYANNQDAARKRTNSINDLGVEQSKQLERSRNLTTDLSKQYDPTTRQASLDEIVGAKEGSIKTALGQADAALPDQGFGGKVSGNYSATKATSDVSEAQRRTDLTRMLAKVLAPSDLRTQEGFNTNDEATKLGTAGTNLRGTTAAANSDISQIAPNALVNFAGSAAQGAGQGLAYSQYADKINGLYKNLFAAQGAGGAFAAGAPAL